MSITTSRAFSEHRVSFACQTAISTCSLGLWQGTPWLYLDEIADELEARCHVRYLSGLCYAMPKRRGHSLQVMRRIARQRDESKRFRYFLALSKVSMCPSQLVFADEVGQDGRGSRRRRGWGEVGAGCDIREFLNRGKHISILALYGSTGFIDFAGMATGWSRPRCTYGLISA